MPSENNDIPDLFKRIEFHRNSIALLPSLLDKRPGVSFLIKKENDSLKEIFCSCRLLQSGSCSHMEELKNIYNLLTEDENKKAFDDLFKSGFWYKLASVLLDGNSTPLKNISVKKILQKSGDIILVKDARNNELMRYFSQNNDTGRFIERCIGKPQDQKTDTVPTRNVILSNLYHQSMTKNEWMMLERGFKTRGQMLEESFWFRAAYHAYREFGNEGFTICPAIDRKSGAFTVTCTNLDNIPAFRFNVPRKVVKKVITTFRDLLSNHYGIPIQPVPLKSIFKVTNNTELDLEVRFTIEELQKKGEDMLIKRKDLERFRYDDLIYIPELGIITELEKPRRERKFNAPVKMVLKKSSIPESADEDENEPDESSIFSKAESVLKIFKEYEKVDITPEAIDRNWCWLSVSYRFGNNDISLDKILKNVRDGQRYIETDNGWVDARSPEILKIAHFFMDIDTEMDSRGLKLNRMDLIRLKMVSKNLNIIGGKTEDLDLFKNLLDLKPSRPVSIPEGLKSGLREYQKLGTEWLHFLFENLFGGLLCDDMGLGKTHQIMAFLLGLREQQKIKDPFLVVCPMTVLSHWQNKIREHAPSLKEIIYHGGDRDLETALKDRNLILTSYGILTRDIEKLKEFSFPVTVFDEVQHIKNAETKAYKAALDINANIKVGLTGTPIENRLEELKALLDLTVPGYLGTDRAFYSRYIKSIQEKKDKKKQEELARIVSPFILRRLKKSVLQELPEKIEDILNCALSKDQISLYRETIESRGAGLLETLRIGKEPVPYMHIFALLNLLKQICNHPALVEKTPENYENYESGKWDVFKEILSESVESGQKVVVYSQYLDMINIIERHLEKQATGFVSLTGKSRNRGEIIKRFSDDPDCRVFIGSLKAGGVGIDLIAASVVIHYDRWWNAAREDQATDRVHRIGQKRGVQVFKLVTEGTLEEKISAIISRKKDLMDSVIKEDDPGLLKGFSREELIDLINF